MPVFRISSTDSLPLTIDEVMADLRIAAEEERDTIERMIRGAAAFLERKTAYVLTPGTFVVNVCDWPSADEGLEIKRGPLRAVTAIRYRTDTETLAANIDDFHVQTCTRAFKITSLSTFTAPGGTPITATDAVQIEFTAGFAGEEDGEESGIAGLVDLDDGLRSLLIATVGLFYKNRELGGVAQEAAADQLLHTYRQIW